MSNDKQRISWDNYFMKLAFMVAERSTCLRRKVGAVAVKDKRILATGYNGAPINMEHCLDIGCLRQKMNIPSGTQHELCRAVHAEQNLIIQAATSGTSILGATIYCTDQPCLICSKMLINCQVEHIFFCHEYPDEVAQEFFREAGIGLEKYVL